MTDVMALLPGTTYHSVGLIKDVLREYGLVLDAIARCTPTEAGHAMRAYIQAAGSFGLQMILAP